MFDTIVINSFLKSEASGVLVRRRGKSSEDHGSNPGARKNETMRHRPFCKSLKYTSVLGANCEPDIVVWLASGRASDNKNLNPTYSPTKGRIRPFITLCKLTETFTRVY